MASDNSTKPILVAGAVGAVLLLGIAWMYAAASGNRAEREAVARYEALGGDTFATAALESASETPEPASSESAQTAEAETEAEESETAEAAPDPEAETKTEETAAEETEPKAEETEAAEADPEPEAQPETEAAAEAEEAEPKAEETETAEAAPAAEETETAEAEPKTEEAEPKDEESETAAPAPAAAETASVSGDAEAGKKVFRKCKACHVVDEEKNRVGPHLVGIIGRAVGAVDGFSYSKVFEEAKAAGKTWTPEELDAYLEAPRKVMPGTKMAFAGLRKADDRADVIAYLAAGE